MAVAEHPARIKLGLEEISPHVKDRVSSGQQVVYFSVLKRAAVRAPKKMEYCSSRMGAIFDHSTAVAAPAPKSPAHRYAVELFRGTRHEPICSAGEWVRMVDGPVQRSLLALVVMLSVLGSLRPARSADLPPVQQTPDYQYLTPAPPPAPPAAALSPDLFDPHGFEFRFGGFAHGVGGAEQGTVDLNPEIVFPRLPFGQGYWWNVLIPRPHAGGLINLEGRTSAVYAGALWTFPLPHRFFAELFLDGDKHDGYVINPPPGHSGLGCPYLFHDGGSLGYNLTQNWSVMFTFDHQSNGHAIFGTACDGMGSNTRNPGINDYGLRIGYAF